MKIAGILLGVLLLVGCGVEGDESHSVLQADDQGKFSGCIDSELFSPQECHYTCEGGRASGYKLDADFCRARGAHGDLACFCL